MCLFFFQAEDGIRDADVTGVQTCALPISAIRVRVPSHYGDRLVRPSAVTAVSVAGQPLDGPRPQIGKSTRLNSSHVRISYAVFCLKKKKILEWRLSHGRGSNFSVLRPELR